MSRYPNAVIGVLAALALCTACARAEVVVNGAPLDAKARSALAEVYGSIPDGAYWYDAASGLWGVAGGPSSGRIMPGLALGGALAANASGGGDGRATAVFINGREIHPDELVLLTRLFGTVIPGRYWLGPLLTGGYEGGPAIFDLRGAASTAASGGPGYNKSTLFGDLMSDGQCAGYFDPSSGSSVMTGNC
ncbi:MAG: hypothetical protein ABL957_01630 [Parvularculaceae bacterium]